MFLKRFLEQETEVMNLAFDCMNAKDTKLSLYSLTLARLCLEKEPETSLRKWKLDFYRLIDVFMDPLNDQVAAEALAALHVVIKSSIQVCSTKFCVFLAIDYLF